MLKNNQPTFGSIFTPYIGVGKLISKINFLIEFYESKGSASRKEMSFLRKETSCQGMETSKDGKEISFHEKETPEAGKGTSFPEKETPKAGLGSMFPIAKNNISLYISTSYTKQKINNN